MYIMNIIHFMSIIHFIIFIILNLVINLNQDLRLQAAQKVGQLYGQVLRPEALRRLRGSHAYFPLIPRLKAYIYHAHSMHNGLLIFT